MHRRSRAGWALLLGALLLLAAIPVAVAATQSTTYAAATADGSGAARPLPLSGPTGCARSRAPIPPRATPSHSHAPRRQRGAARPPHRCWRTSTGRAAATAPSTNFGRGVRAAGSGAVRRQRLSCVEMVNSAYTVYKHQRQPVCNARSTSTAPSMRALTEFTSDPRCQYDAGHSHVVRDRSLHRAPIARRRGSTSRSTPPATRPRRGRPTGSTRPTPAGPSPVVRASAISRRSESTARTSTSRRTSFRSPDLSSTAHRSTSSRRPTSSRPVRPRSRLTMSTSATSASAGRRPRRSSRRSPPGSPGAEYFLSSLDPNGTFDQRVGVWALTNVNGIDKGVKPTLSSHVATSEAYGIPPSAEQKGASSLIDTGDDRMQQVQYINGHVLGALDTSVTIPGDPAARAGAAWFDVDADAGQGRRHRCEPQGTATSSRPATMSCTRRSRRAPDGSDGDGLLGLPAPASTRARPTRSRMPARHRSGRSRWPVPEPGQLRPERHPLGRLLMGDPRSVRASPYGARPSTCRPCPAKLRTGSATGARACSTSPPRSGERIRWPAFGGLPDPAVELDRHTGEVASGH